MKTLLIDIETYSEEDLPKSGVYRYAESDSFRVLLFSYSIDYAPAEIVSIATGETIPAEVLSAMFDPGVLKLAHNMVFEITCLSKYFGRELDPSQWDDTMIWAARLGFPMSLSTLSKVLNLEQKKLDTGTTLINLFSKPKNGKQNTPSDYPEKWEQFKTYCLRDVDSEVEVAKRLQGRVEVPLWERDLQLADLRINKRGVRISKTLAANALRFRQVNTDELTEEAKRITGLDNPNSVVQLKRWMEEKTGVKMDALNKESISGLDMKSLDPDVKRVIEIRSELGKTSLAKYSAMLDCVCRDGRVRGLIQYYGASQTGRFAGRMVQTQNLPQNHLKSLDEAREMVLADDYDSMEFTYNSVTHTLSELIRTAFIPSKGNTFHICDFSAIEARVIAWLAGEQWVLDTFIQGGDIYCATASRMFGVPVEKHGQNAELRQKGKIAQLALGYQGGVGAMRKMGGERLGLTEQEMNSIVKLWRSSNKNIVNLWSVLEKAAVCAIRSAKPVEVNQGVTYYFKYGTLFCKLPSGRSIAYPRARVCEDQLGTRITYERMNQTTHKWERADTYGGKLTENVVQAVARDILGMVILRAEKQGLDIVFHVHDEIIVDAPEGRTLKEIEDIFSTPISWCQGLPLKGAGYSGKYYFKD